MSRGTTPLSQDRLHWSPPQPLYTSLNEKKTSVNAWACHSLLPSFNSFYAVGLSRSAEAIDCIVNRPITNAVTLRPYRFSERRSSDWSRLLSTIITACKQLYIMYGRTTFRTFRFLCKALWVVWRRMLSVNSLPHWRLARPQQLTVQCRCTVPYMFMKLWYVLVRWVTGLQRAMHENNGFTFVKIAKKNLV